jgi:hypothetical protein
MIEINDYTELAFLRFLEKRKIENFELDNIETLIEEYLKINCQYWDLKFFIKLFQDYTIRKQPQETDNIGELFSQFCRNSRSIIYIMPESINKKPSLQQFLFEFFKFMKRRREYNDLNAFLKRKAIESYDNNSGLDSWFEEVINRNGETLINLFNEFISKPLFYNQYIDFVRWQNRKKKMYPPITRGDELKSLFSFQGFGFSFEERRQKLRLLVHNGSKIQGSPSKLLVYNEQFGDRTVQDDSFLYIDFLRFLELQNININKNLTYSVLLDYIEEYCKEFGNKKRTKLVKFAKSISKKDSFFISMLSSLFKERGLKFSLDRVNVPLVHGLILFPEYRGISSFLKKYWKDIHFMTGDIMDIYYTLDDFKNDGNGFERLSNMPNIMVENDDLPILLVWQKFGGEFKSINLDGLEDIEIFKVIKFFRDGIRKKIEFNQCVEETREKVKQLIEEKRQRTKTEVKIENSQIGSVGDNAISINNFERIN